MSVSLTTAARHEQIAPQVSYAPLPRNAPSEHNGFDLTGVSINFAANQQIYAEGDEARLFYKVVSGVVRTCWFLSDGHRQIDAFHYEGNVFGFEAGAEHSISAEAVSDCTVIAYRRRGLEAMICQDDRLNHWFFSHAMNTMEQAREHALLLGRGSASQKIAAFLQELVEHGGGSSTIELAMSRQDIADYLGTTIETVSRTLSQLDRDGVIERPSIRRVVIKNLPKLRALNS
jgi:CRP/FNR family transcriptional regulator, nitrogen fixation regulation protein